ncbi:hypothetical protein PG985_003326 [Apiospora marii]|uniref:uncharacterized protein n=1 Tax=Apiospora marii TaxID=335849 RepID=UPI0031300275
MSSQAGPKPAEASHNGQPSTKRISLPPEIHRMIFSAIDDPKDRTKTTLSVMLANKELHGLWKRFLYEDNINNGGSSALVYAALHGLHQPIRDIFGVGTTAEGKTVNMNLHIQDFAARSWCFDPTRGDGYMDRKNCLTPLHAAVSCCDEETVRVLLENGADVNAVGYGDEYDVYLDTRSKPEDWDWYDEPRVRAGGNQSAIHVATCQGHLPIVQLLVDARSTLLWDPTQSEGFTVLHTAALCGHVHLVRYFVTMGLIPVDIQAPYFSKKQGKRLPTLLTAAQCAAQTMAGSKILWVFRELGSDMSLVVLSLLQSHADPKMTQDNQPPADTTMARQLLTQASWKVDLKTNVLEWNGGKYSLADAILELYLSSDKRNVTFQAPQTWRAIVRAALACGLDTSPLQRQPLRCPEKSSLENCLALFSGEKGLMLMEIILELEAQAHTTPRHFNFKDHGNLLLLHSLTDAFLRRMPGGWVWEQSSPQDTERLLRTSSTWDERSEVVERKVQVLLGTGVQVKGVNDYGWTCLITACSMGAPLTYSLNLMKMLLDAGADPNETNQVTSALSNGKIRSPMAVCFSKHSYEACKLLQSYGGTLHKDDDLQMIKGCIEKHASAFLKYPYRYGYTFRYTSDTLGRASSKETREMDLFNELAAQIKHDR